MVAHQVSPRPRRSHPMGAAGAKALNLAEERALSNSTPPEHELMAFGRGLLKDADARRHEPCGGVRVGARRLRQDRQQLLDLFVRDRLHLACNAGRGFGRRRRLWSLWPTRPGPPACAASAPQALSLGVMSRALPVGDCTIPFGLTIETIPTHLPLPAKIRTELLDPITAPDWMTTSLAGSAIREWGIAASSFGPTATVNVRRDAHRTVAAMCTPWSRSSPSTRCLAECGVWTGRDRIMWR